MQTRVTGRKMSTQHMDQRKIDSDEYEGGIKEEEPMAKGQKKLGATVHALGCNGVYMTSPSRTREACRQPDKWERLSLERLNLIACLSFWNCLDSSRT
jgi:hypothetical protein